MKLLSLFSMALLFAVLLPMSAAKQPTWSAKVEGKAVAIFTHSFTGIPVVETSTHYYGINYVNQSILWTVEKPSSAAAVSAASDIGAMTGAADIEKPELFEEIPMTPFVSINNKFADVSTGKVLFGTDQSAYKEIVSTDIMPSIYKLLVKVIDINRATVLYCVDLQTKALDWKCVLAEGSLSGDAMKMAKASMNTNIINVFAPKTISNNNIVYKNEKDLFLLDHKTGDVVWKNTCKPGTFFLDDNEKYLVVVEQASSASGMMSVSGTSFSKKIFALDVATGEHLWKEPVKLSEKYIAHKNIDGNKFIAAHRKGVNIYDFATGKQEWKKDYESKRIQEINIKNDGIELFYGNKLMLVDHETGKKAWKKPIEYKDVPEDEEGAMVKKDYSKGTFIMGGSFVGLYDKTTGKKIWSTKINTESKVAFDERNKKVAIIDGKKFYLFDPNTVVKKPEKIKLDVNKPKELIGFETRESGYFITGMNEFIMLNKDASLAAADYFKPLKTDRLLKAALTTTAIASGIASTEYSVQDEDGNELASGGLFMSKENARAMGEVSDAQFNAVKKLKEAAKLNSAAQSTKDHVYFLKGSKTDNGDEMAIIKVEKDSGKEVDSFDFGDDRKVIYQLDKLTNRLYFLDDDEIKVFNLE